MRRIGITTCALAAAALAAGCGPNSNDVIACDPQGCISEAKLLQNISDTLKGKVVGYTAVVGGLFIASDGMARTNTDPPSLKMDPTIPGNMASVSKTLTAVAVLQLLAKNGLTIDSNIAPYLYSDWCKGRTSGRSRFGNC